jgi:hypothetical protein
MFAFALTSSNLGRIRARRLAHVCERGARFRRRARTCFLICCWIIFAEERQIHHYGWEIKCTSVKDKRNCRTGVRIVELSDAVECSPTTTSGSHARTHQRPSIQLRANHNSHAHSGVPSILSRWEAVSVRRGACARTFVRWFAQNKHVASRRVTGSVSTTTQHYDSNYKTIILFDYVQP